MTREEMIQVGLAVLADHHCDSWTRTILEHIIKEDWSSEQVVDYMIATAHGRQATLDLRPSPGLS